MKLNPTVQLRTAQRDPTKSLAAFARVGVAMKRHAAFATFQRVHVSTTVWSETFQQISVDELATTLDDVSDRIARVGGGVSLKGLTANWPVQRNQKPLTLSLSPQEGQLSDQVQIQNLDTVPEDVANELWRAVAAEFPGLSYRDLRLAGLPDELRKFHLAQEKAFADRESSLIAGHKKIQDSIETAHANAESRVKEAQEKYANLEKELEAHHAAKLAHVEKREQELAAARKELDDRERMHARRKHEQVLKDLIEGQKKFAVSAQTTDKRSSVAWLCRLGIGLGVALYIAVAYSVLVREHELSAMLWSMLGTATLLTGSMLVFALRWTNAWAQKHADLETTALVFNQDFTRASWLVEFMFEWQKENADKPIPAEFLRTLATRLFERDRGGMVEHPAAQLLSSLSRVKTVEVDKKKVRVEQVPQP